MAHYFGQYEVNPCVVDGSYSPAGQARQLLDLLNEVGNHRGLSQDELVVEREGLDHNGPEGTDPAWFERWKHRVKDVLNDKTNPSYIWAWVKGDLGLFDLEDPAILEY